MAVDSLRSMQKVLGVSCNSRYLLTVVQHCQSASVAAPTLNASALRLTPGLRRYRYLSEACGPQISRLWLLGRPAYLIIATSGGLLLKMRTEEYDILAQIAACLIFVYDVVDVVEMRCK